MIGHTIAGCRIVEAIGQGGFGTVYKAVQESLDRTVALKIVPRESDPNSHSIFDHVGPAAKLEHPNIVRVYGYGREAGVEFVIMEYVSGRTLDRVLAARRKLPQAEAVDIAGQIASALEHAHLRGIVHSDLNPRNVIISESGRAVLGDFIGSRPADPGGRKVIGVPEYVSPEQARGLRATISSDIYSLGIILYEMLTGRQAISEKTPSETLFKQISADPEPPAKLVESIHPKLNGLVMAMMSKNPDARPDSCAKAVQELKSIQRELQRGKTSSRARRPVSRALVIAFALVLAAAGAVGYLIERSVAEERKLDALAEDWSGGTAPTLERSLEGRFNDEIRSGRMLLDRGEFRAAATAFHRACKLRPDMPDPHLFLAAVFIERQDYKLARSELEAALKLDSANAEAKSALEYVESKLRAAEGQGGAQE
ncbi:MAG: protein kinase [Armatimonadetes bacterium]|nr:protein kinase [Armatimonadota bacterium]